MDKRLVFVLFTVLLLVGSGFSVYFYSQVEDLEEENSRFLVELNEANEEIGSLSSSLNNSIERVNELSSRVENLSFSLSEARERIERLTYRRTCSYFMVGVAGGGEGTVIDLRVEVVDGDGDILIDASRVSYGSETQQSFRTAVFVAERFTGQSLQGKDVVFSFENPSREVFTVEGGSAGAAETVALIGAVQNQSPSEKVLITGTIERNGDIGKVGLIEEKALAARRHGAEIFLVPEGQKVSIEGIRVIEVADIGEAKRYIFR